MENSELSISQRVQFADLAVETFAFVLFLEPNDKIQNFTLELARELKGKFQEFEHFVEYFIYHHTDGYRKACLQLARLLVGTFTYCMDSVTRYLIAEERNLDFGEPDAAEKADYPPIKIAS